MMFARRALSMAFWSATRLLDTSFFCTRHQRKSSHIDLLRLFIIRTCAFSPCLKKASSEAFSLAFSPTKYLDVETSLILASGTPARSTLSEVAMTYLELTRRRGTPLILKGPVTSRTPWSRVLSRTTRLPRKRPARRIRTVPG